MDISKIKTSLESAEARAVPTREMLETSAIRVDEGQSVQATEKGVYLFIPIDRAFELAESDPARFNRMKRLPKGVESIDAAERLYLNTAASSVQIGGATFTIRPSVGLTA